MAKEQLVHIHKEFEMWSHFSPLDSKLKIKTVRELPFIRWPDNVPCIEANLYMLSLLNRSLKGGTLRTYSFNASHLLRYCFDSQINITDLTDSRFELFIRSLQGERSFKGERARTNDQVIKIGRACISFLGFVARIHSLENFIGKEDFNAIRVEEKKYKLTYEGSKKQTTKYYWHHDSFPKPGAKKKRHPIGIDAVNAIKDVVNSQKDPKIVKRDFCLIQIFELTGARRSEVTMLKVADVKEAFDSSIGLTTATLRFSTLKRKDLNSERFIPVPKVLINNLMDYIRTTRRRIIRNTVGKANDHGFVFTAHTTGAPLSDGTLGTYINTWRKKAGIEEEVHWHLFRHAFITNKFIDLIEEHDFENKDEFRKILFNTERFKMQIREWTGHTHMYSLDIYLDLAFASVAGADKTYDSVMLKSSVDAYVDTLNMLETQKNKRIISEKEFNKEIVRLSNELKESLLRERS